METNWAMVKRPGQLFTRASFLPEPKSAKSTRILQGPRRIVAIGIWFSDFKILLLTMKEAELKKKFYIEDPSFFAYLTTQHLFFETSTFIFSGIFLSLPNMI